MSVGQLPEPSVPATLGTLISISNRSLERCLEEGLSTTWGDIFRQISDECCVVLLH